MTFDVSRPYNFLAASDGRQMLAGIMPSKTLGMEEIHRYLRENLPTEQKDDMDYVLVIGEKDGQRAMKVLFQAIKELDPSVGRLSEFSIIVPRSNALKKYPGSDTRTNHHLMEQYRSIENGVVTSGAFLTIVVDDDVFMAASIRVNTFIRDNCHYGYSEKE